MTDLREAQAALRETKQAYFEAQKTWAIALAETYGLKRGVKVKWSPDGEGWLTGIVTGAVPVETAPVDRFGIHPDTGFRVCVSKTGEGEPSFRKGYFDVMKNKWEIIK